MDTVSEGVSTGTHHILANYAHHTSVNCHHQKLENLAAQYNAQSGVLLFCLNLHGHTVKGDGRPNVKKGKEIYFCPPLMDAHHRYWYHTTTTHNTYHVLLFRCTLKVNMPLALDS